VALQSVAARSWPGGSNFRVVSIPHPSLPLTSFPEEEFKDVTSVKHANHSAKSGAEVLRTAGLRAESSILLPYHTDGREIVEEARRWPADLIVLGSHGRRGINRLRLGSVSEYVVCHAPCSVQVIRRTLAETETSHLQTPVINVTVPKSVVDQDRFATPK